MDASRLGQVNFVELLLAAGANMCSKATEGSTCLSVTKSKEVKSILKKWEMTIPLIVLQELKVLPSLDPSSFLELSLFIG